MSGESSRRVDGENIGPGALYVTADDGEPVEYEWLFVKDTASGPLGAPYVDIMAEGIMGDEIVSEQWRLADVEDQTETMQPAEWDERLAIGSKLVLMAAEIINGGL